MITFVMFLVTSTCNRVNAFVSLASIAKSAPTTTATAKAPDLHVLPSTSMFMVATRPDLLGGFLAPSPPKKKSRIFIPEETESATVTHPSSSPSGSERLNNARSATHQAVSLVDISWLKPHEEITGVDRVKNLYESIIECDAYIVPLLVDSRSGAILDGHHRYAVGRIMELNRLPVVLVDYLNDESIELDVWPDCGIDCLTKQEVVEMSRSKKLFPPKTSRHDCVLSFAPINVPLEKLRRS